ncbi:unnamed protein product, partial [Effrenium voratum]
QSLQLLAVMLGLRIEATNVALNAAISSCEKARQWQRALALLAEMDSRLLRKDVISYNAALSACEKCSRWQAQLVLLHTMRSVSVAFDSFSLNAALLCCRGTGRWRLAVALFLELAGAGDALSWDIAVGSCEASAAALAARTLLGAAEAETQRGLPRFLREEHR